MQDRRSEEASSKQRRGSNLVPLAPRDPRPSSTRDRTTGSSSTGRPPRLSHRSRAGCWTCRGRKVKCDESHPRCGPCTRLNRECDWDHRWNFNDSTPSTQGKYSNVNTSGNIVWDPAVGHRWSTSPTSREHEDLPEFASLTSDEDRERKAGTQRPGTFGVVVTPESFHDLPEYASTSQSPFGSRRLSSGTSSASSRGGHKRSPRSSFRRTNTQPDPNTVVLERFEETSPVSARSYAAASATESRRSSYPEELQRLRITTPSLHSNTSTAPHTPTFRPEDSLATHFRHYIVPRLVQPQQNSAPGLISQGSTKDVLEAEAARFQPLHHAICAISALNLANNGRSSLEEAMQHYHQALAASATATSPNDLLSDGVFFRHYLLFIYDICIPMQSDEDGTDMWAEHLNHLLRITIQRRENNGREPFAYTLWTICELDTYACLMGSGNADFVRMMLERNMLPPLDQQVPGLTTIQTGTFLSHEMHMFPSILRLNQGIVLLAAKLARTAQAFRSEMTSSPGARARWHSTATQLQTEIISFWHQNYPHQHLGQSMVESPQAAAHLPERIRAVFEHALALYHATIIYARTSMFPSQRTIPLAGLHDLLADTERRASTILQIAEYEVEMGFFERRHILFPVFMAGFASANEAMKGRAVELVASFEGYGIGSNTRRMRLLLEAVWEEQRRGQREELEVDWVRVARERGLGVVNCGL